MTAQDIIDELLRTERNKQRIEYLRALRAIYGRQDEIMGQLATSVILCRSQRQGFMDA